MSQILNYDPALTPVRIKAGAEWRGVKYFFPKIFSLSPEYAKHVVETLKVGEYVKVDTNGNILDEEDEATLHAALNDLQREAIATANAHLSNVSLPTYDDLVRELDLLAPAVARQTNLISMGQLPLPDAALFMLARVKGEKL